MVPRLARWYDERPITGDACLAVLLLVAFVPPSDLAAETDPGDRRGTCRLCGGGPRGRVRRRRPRLSGPRRDGRHRRHLRGPGRLRASEPAGGRVPPRRRRRLPRRLVIIPALAGSVFAMAHALTAYVTKPLHHLGAVDLEFHSWARLDEGKLIAWDLLFYEPWFLALGLLVTLGALHHHRRSGGTDRGARRMLALTAAGTLALTALASASVVTGA